MPSEDLVRSALSAVRTRADAFRTAIDMTARELRGHLQTRPAGCDGDGRVAAAALGRFAAGRIDPHRFSRVLSLERPADAGWAGPAERALAILDELDARGDDLFRLRVPAGADLHTVVDLALADAGRAFGAARLATLARTSQYRPAEHDAFLQSFPFRQWSRAERQLAPPLVIEVAGEDLAAAGLAPYLDGQQAFVLIVDGAAPPAALARLITPGVLVAQGDGADALAAMDDSDAPAAVAIITGDVARFVHRSGEVDGAGAIEVSHLPTREPRRPVGSISVFQQQQELRLLNRLSAVRAVAPAEPPSSTANGHAAPAAAEMVSRLNGVPHPSAPADPVGALAAWLLQQVDLSDLEAVVS